jgi:CheY-like chemotaxis protein
MASRKQIGNLLVEAGIITVKTLERSLQMQNGSGKRLGTLLTEIGVVTEEEIAEALAKQCDLRTVKNFSGQPFPKELLDLVPVQLALEKLVFPLKHHEGMLAIATLDPFDRVTFECLAEKTGMKIYPVLATRDDIFSAIKKHYLKGKGEKSSRQKVLLLDPSPIVTKMLEPSLAREGYEVLVAHDGIDGLKLAYAHHPDLIVCDSMMPRMDGYHFMLALRAHPETTDMPVILLSAIASSEEERRALKAGFSDVIGKPAMPVRVLARVKILLSSLGSERHPVPHHALPVPLLEVPPWLRRNYMRNT